MAKDIDYLKLEVGEIKQLIKDHTVSEELVWEKIMNKIDEKMEKKANIWVEKAVSWALYLVGGTIILAIIGLVINTAKNAGKL